MAPPVLLAAEVLSSDTLVPVGATLSVLVMVVAGSRAYESLRGTQNTQRQDLDAVEEMVGKMREEQDRRHEGIVHRVAIIESREAVHDQRMAGVEDHLRQQDKKLDKIDDKLDRALMRADHSHRHKGDAA